MTRFEQVSEAITLPWNTHYLSVSVLSTFRIFVSFCLSYLCLSLLSLSVSPSITVFLSVSSILCLSIYFINVYLFSFCLLHSLYPSSIALNLYFLCVSSLYFFLHIWSSRVLILSFLLYLFSLCLCSIFSLPIWSFCVLTLVFGLCLWPIL